MSDFLAEVTAKTRKRVEVQKHQVPLTQLKAMSFNAKPVKSFRSAIHRPGQMTLIAELKQASPSAGVIRKVTDIGERIQAYTRGGAAALSILTEEDYFHGSPQFLESMHQTTPLPILRKDFIIDLYQIAESRQLGASAILLISSLLPGHQLNEFIIAATEGGLDTLVEVHTEQDLEHALKAEAPVIGINNRDLHTLKVDTSTAAKLLLKAPQKDVVLVVESGVRSPAEIPVLRQMGAHAVLIGETLMRADDPEKLVKEFVQACQK